MAKKTVINVNGQEFCVPINWRVVLATLRARGWDAEELERRTGCSANSVRSLVNDPRRKDCCSRLALPLLAILTSNEHATRTRGRYRKLTDEDRAKVIRMYRPGITTLDGVAETIGCSVGTVWEIVKKAGRNAAAASRAGRGSTIDAQDMPR